MLAKKTFLYLLSSVLFFLVLSFFTSAQDDPNETQDSSTSSEISSPVIDSIDYGENLLDSNEAYKKLYEDLSEDGEWISASKAQFVSEVTAETGENLDSYYPENNEVIYVWKPNVSTYDWNPYTNGRWSFSNYGWTWLSNYNWARSQYNYGRWFWSNYYGWVWIPGRVWAANWVNWRYNNNYVGWYPTCPGIHWNYGNKIYRNRLFTYYPKNWVFVNKKDFTKKIDKNTIVRADINPGILKNSEKVKTAMYEDPGNIKFKYSGPEVKEISKETGQKIYPKKIDVTNYGTKQYSGVINNSVKGESVNLPVKENSSKPNPAEIEFKKSVKEESNNKTETGKTNTSNNPVAKDIRTKQTEEPKQNKRTNETKPERKIERTKESIIEKGKEESKEKKIEKINAETEKINNNNNNNNDEKSSNNYIEEISNVKTENYKENISEGSLQSNSENRSEVTNEYSTELKNQTVGESNEEKKTEVIENSNNNKSTENKSEENIIPENNEPPNSFVRPD